jgi:hypothetical protein
MDKITLNENTLKQIIREAIEKELNEGLGNFLRGRTEDTRVKINSCCDGSYRYSSKTGTYWYYSFNMDVEPCDTRIGYNRKILTVDDKVTKQEKQNVIYLLTRWDRKEAQNIENNAKRTRERNQHYYDEEQAAKQDRWNREQQWRKEDAAEADSRYFSALRDQHLGQHVNDGLYRNY